MNAETADRIARICAGLAAVGCLAVGIPTLADPDGIAAFIDYTLPTPFARSEFMTVYGGFYTGAGVAYATAVFMRALRPGGLAFFGFTAVGAFLTRLLTGPLDQSRTLLLLGSELLLAVIGLVGWWAAVQATGPVEEE